MPGFEATVDGKSRRIDITEKGEGSFEAKIDGKLRSVELPIQAASSGQVLTVKVDGKNFRVELPIVERDRPVSVNVEDVTFTVEVKTPSRKQAIASFEPAPTTSTRRAGTGRQVAAEGAVTSPMTGKVVSVRVRAGDQVKANQVLCVIEAMKMENEIVAPKAGVLQEINVAEGQPVNEGDTLLVIS